VHAEFEAAAGIHVVLDQGRDGESVARREPVGPMGSGEDRLQHEGVVGTQQPDLARAQPMTIGDQEQGAVP